MTNYEKSEYYRLNSEAWLLFYQGFHKSTNAILNCRSVILDMQSEIIKATILNPKNSKINSSQERIDMLSENLDILEILNNRCVQQQEQLKKYKEKIFEMENRLSEIERQEKEGFSV